MEKFNSQTTKMEELRSAAEAEKNKSKDGTKQMTLTNSGQINYSINPEIQKRWDKAVVDFVVETLVPFSSTEALPILLKSLWPSGTMKVKVKDQRTVAAHVEKEHDRIQNEIYSIIQHAKNEQNVKLFSFTTDLWSNRKQVSFMSLTIHFIDMDFNIWKFVPFMEMFTGEHSGKNLALKLSTFLAKFGLDDEDIIRIVIADNASNNRVMIRLSPDIIGYPCSNHTLQLCVVDLFKLNLCGDTISEVSKKCHECAVFLRGSGKRIEAFEDACKQTGTKFGMLVMAQQVRWNNRYENISSVLKMKKPLQLLALNHNEWARVIPTPSQFQLAESVREILEPAKIMTKTLEADERPTIHHVVTQTYNMKEKLVKANSHIDVNIQSMAETLETNLDKRFPNSGTDNVFNCMSHYLDPASKGIILHEFEKFESTKEEIVKMCRRYIPAAHPQENAQPQIEDEVCEDDDNLTGVERLLKRRRLSGDLSVRPAAQSVSEIDVEMQNYEALPVS